MVVACDEKDNVSKGRMGSFTQVRIMHRRVEFGRVEIVCIVMLVCYKYIDPRDNPISEYT